MVVDSDLVPRSRFRCVCMFRFQDLSVGLSFSECMNMDVITFWEAYIPSKFKNIVSMTRLDAVDLVQWGDSVLCV